MAELGGVVLAAGRGARLGGVAKALLQRKDGRTFLAAIAGAARAAGARELVVVVGPPYGDAVEAHARTLGARVVWNPRPERGMASSVALGFAAMTETDCDAAWLWPVDHPDVAPATLRGLAAALGTHDAVRPVVGGRGGHPPLVARRLWPRLAAAGELDGGARAVLGAADMVDLVVDDAGCVRDVDTAAELEALP